MSIGLTHIRDLNERDPFIVAYEPEKKYFLYTSKPIKGQQGRAINVRESEDLQWWSDSYPVFEANDEFWGSYDFWAPECHLWKEKYYLISSFRSLGGYRRCQCLVADTPRGPFEPMVNEPSTPEGWHCLDGTLYEDRMGNPWMVFCHEWPQVQDGQIAAVPLTDDLSKQAGDPTILFRASEAPWKFTDSELPWLFTEPQPAIGWARVTDGPFLYRAQNGELLMLWSSFSNTGYTIGYARSVSGEIQGPWIQEKEPIFSQDGGHGMMFISFDGKLILTVHSPNIMGKEHLLLFEMEDRNGKLNIINELTGNWIPNRYYPDGRDVGQKPRRDTNK
ncbi:MAG: family 43 glycosylhydrolase [Clostridiaceae bacterium]|nr:family 43 glycosylhydrolase [Clostridiaceae bacterium]